MQLIIFLILSYYMKINTATLGGLLLIYIVFMGPTSLFAQTSNNVNILDMQEYSTLTLPPLDVLFENSKNAPTYELAIVTEQVERSLLRKERLAWLGFFSIRGSWQYGTFANDGYLSTIYDQPTYSYTKTDQTLYSVGASINIPIDELFDLGGRVKRQKLSLKSAQLLKEQKYQEVKKEIVELYATVKAQLNILKLRAESVVLANEQYRILERNFANGTASSDELANQKENQSMASQHYEQSKFELNKSLLILEIITNTTIVRR